MNISNVTMVGTPERIDRYDSDHYLFGKCSCKICQKSPLYYIPIKKHHKDPHIYKYRCADCGFEGTVIG